MMYILNMLVLGSDWVFISFDSEVACSKFKKNLQVLKLCFQTYDLLLTGFIYWIELFGIKLWVCLVVFGMMRRYLKLLIYGARFVKRVCIKYSKPSLIHEVLDVKVQRMQYEVVVWELSNWEPNIVHGQKDLDWDIPHLSVR